MPVELRSVIFGSLWRRMRCTAGRLAPFIMSRLAVVWRRSWKRMGRTTGFTQSFRRSFGQRLVSWSAPASSCPQPFLRQEYSPPPPPPRGPAPGGASSRGSRPAASWFRRDAEKPAPRERPPWQSAGRAGVGRMGMPSTWPPFVVSRSWDWATISIWRGRSTSDFRSASSSPLRRPV